MCGANQQSLAVGIDNQQPMTSEMSNQPVFNSGLSSQQIMDMGGVNQQAISSSTHGKLVSASQLVRAILSLLERGKGSCMQLQSLYQKFQSKEITKGAFFQHMRTIVGDQKIRMVLNKFKRQNPRDAAAQQHMQAPSNVPAELSGFALDYNALQQYEVGNKGDSHNMQATQMPSSYFNVSSQDMEHPTYPVQGDNKHQQQHLHLSQESFPTYGSTSKNHRPFPASNVITLAASLKQACDSERRQLPVHRDLSACQLGTPSQVLSSVPTVRAECGNDNPGNPRNGALEMQSSKRGFLASTSQIDYKLPVPSAPSATAVANISAGQKKPLQALGSTPSPPSKKQKMSGGAFIDQTIKQFNDVTADSGVNLREEEELLFFRPKEDGQVSRASGRVVQEEEDRLILQKIPLQKKLAIIMAKSGLKSTGSDVEKCLSLCFEKRIRGLMSRLIRLSKQRVDIEKPRHRTFITTDVRKKIMAINNEVKVECEKKEPEEEELERLNKANKEEDEKMYTTAANVAIRAAVGGDDMLSKWKLMAEQARQILKGGTDGSYGSRAGKDVSRKTLTAGKSQRDHHKSEKRGSIRKLGRNQVIMAHNRVARAICVKDVIAVLEREVQMSTSTLIYRLYCEIYSGSSAHSAD